MEFVHSPVNIHFVNFFFFFLDLIIKQDGAPDSECKSAAEAKKKNTFIECGISLCSVSSTFVDLALFLCNFIQGEIITTYMGDGIQLLSILITECALAVGNTATHSTSAK